MHRNGADRTITPHRTSTRSARPNSCTCARARVSPRLPRSLSVFAMSFATTENHPNLRTGTTKFVPSRLFSVAALAHVQEREASGVELRSGDPKTNAQPSPERESDEAPPRMSNGQRRHRCRSLPSTSLHEMTANGVFDASTLGRQPWHASVPRCQQNARCAVHLFPSEVIRDVCRAHGHRYCPMAQQRP